MPDQVPFLELRTTRHSLLSYAEHFHETFCIGAITEGGTNLTLQDETRFLETGDIVVIPPGTVHSCNPANGLPRSYHMLYLNMEWCRELAADRLGWPDIGVRRFVLKDAVLFETVRGLADAGFDLPDSARIFSDFMVSVLSRCGEASMPVAEKESRERLLYAAVEAAARSDSCALPSISSLAGAAGIRRETFARSVRKMTGLSPLAYLHSLRLEKARASLRNGESIPQVALAAGYADQSHFHRAFVRYFSATPGSYRKGWSHSYKK